MDIALPPRERPTMIRIVEYNGIVRLTQFFKFAQFVTYPFIHEEEIIEVARPVFPDNRGIGVVGGQHDLARRHDTPGWILLPAPAVSAVRGLTLMGKRGIKHRKEGLTFAAIPVVGLTTALVPAHRLPTRPLPVDRHVVVRLGVVGAIVARVPEELWVVDHRPGHGHAAAVIVDAKGRGIHPRNQGRARSRTNWRRGKGIKISHPLPCKPVKIWRPRLQVPIASQIWAVVFTRDPEDIGAIRFSRHEGAEGGQDYEEGESYHRCGLPVSFLNGNPLGRPAHSQGAPGMQACLSPHYLFR